ncbi:MAG: AMP-binding protein [Bacteroidota bacterium]
MNVIRLFAEQARARPEAEALVEGRGVSRLGVTFGELERRGAEAAGRLVRDGLKPGDVALVLVPLSVDLYVLVAGILRVGGVVMLVDPGAGREHLAACLQRRPPDVFIGTPCAHALRIVSREVRRIPRRYTVGGWVPGAARWGGGEAAPVAELPDEAPALLTFTSGSTGRPKAIVRSHGFLAAQHRALARALRLGPGQRDLSTLPVFVLANLASGATSLLPDAELRRPGAIDPGPVLAQIRAEAPTRATASPAVYERLLPAATPADLASLTRLDVGGAPVFPDLLARLSAAAPVAEAVAVYGSSEAEPIAHLSASDLTEADRAHVASGGGLPAGRPVPDVDLRIVRDAWGTSLGPFTEAEWDRLGVPMGEPGEIVVAGDHVLAGYLDGEGDAETKVRVGARVWHRTGDAGRLDPDGRLWLLGRCSAAVRETSGTLYPLQVEAAAREVAGVRLGALVPGRRLVAFEGTAEAGDVADALAWAEVEAVRVDRIPLDRRHNAKVDYPALGSLLAP